MQLLYADYIDLVLHYCNKKRRDPASSSLLAVVTPAGIRDACLNVYTERKNDSEREGQKVLKDFFGSPPAGKDFSYIISRFPPEKFKPLQKFINGKIKSPGVTNVELLAWLIDFPYRPFTTAIDVELTEEEKAVISKQGNKVDEEYAMEAQVDNPTDEAVEQKEGVTEAAEKAPLLPVIPADKKPKRVIGMVLLLLAVLFGAGYFIFRRSPPQQNTLLSSGVSCMYWNGDHYEQTPCTDARKDRFKLPLDTQKLYHFKRITQEDTITERSIGKVHYIKLDGRIEYYTTGGNHPVSVTRTLQPLTSYMFLKHLKKS